MATAAYSCNNKHGRRGGLVGVVTAAHFLAVMLPCAGANSSAPPPSNDGTSIDQGIAYFLMLVALILTYLIHPMDASPYNFF